MFLRTFFGAIALSVLLIKPGWAEVELLDIPACSELELRVAGLFRVGTARLYLDNCHEARNQILSPVPKQFSLRLARPFSGQDLSETAYDLLRRNLHLTEDEPLPESLACLAKAYVDGEPGDRFDVTYRPEIGLALRLNGNLVQFCEDASYAEQYFSIWFGDEPFHRRMREVLLDRAENSDRG